MSEYVGGGTEAPLSVQMGFYADKFLEIRCNCGNNFSLENPPFNMDFSRNGWTFYNNPNSQNWTVQMKSND